MAPRSGSTLTGWACSSACSAPTCCCGSSTWSESRFRGPSLAWPVWLSILLTLLGEGWSLLAVTDDALQGWNWQALVYFALLALIGATTLWLGLRLLKQENLYPSLRIMAWLDIAGGAMLASVLLLVLAVLPLLAATVAMALACWRGAGVERS